MRAVSAVIPTFNARTQLQKHLPAVEKCLQPGDELLLVDDASTDTTVSWLVEQYELEEVSCSQTERVFRSRKRNTVVTLVALRKNLRFAAAVNHGVRHAQHSLIFLLNNDVEPEPSVLSVLIPHFDDPLVFAVACREFAGKSGPESGKNCLWFARGLFQHSRAETQTAGETAWASGGSALFDVRKWRKLGGFDERYYPAYWEDVDLSFRARKRGWRVLFEPRATVYHLHETTHKTVFGSHRIAEMSWKHAELFTRTHASPRQLLEYYLWKPFWFIQRLRAQ